MKRETLIEMIDYVLKANDQALSCNDPEDDPEVFKMATILKCWKEDIETDEYSGPSPLMIWALRHGIRFADPWSNKSSEMQAVVEYFLETAKPKRRAKRMA